MEKLFGVTKRRYKPAQRQKIIIVSAPSCLDECVFPAPSFIQPCSIPMEPRTESEISVFERVERKWRSNSLPCPALDGERLSSSDMSGTLDSLPSLSEGSSLRPVSIIFDDSTPVMQDPRVSEIRFPEDSLFKGSDGRASMRFSHAEQEVSEAQRKSHMWKTPSGGLLDWSPKHISLFFDPMEMPSFMDQPPPLPTSQPPLPTSHPLLAKSQTPPPKSQPSLPRKPENPQSILMPSPMMPSLNVAALEESQLQGDDRSLYMRRKAGGSRPDQKFSLFPKLSSTPGLPSPSIDSPPASDSDDDYAEHTILAPAPAAILGHSSRQMTPRASPERETPTHERRQGVLLTPKESRGDRLAVPRPAAQKGQTSERMPSRSLLLRKSTSALTLKALRSHSSKDQILKEPSFDDFMALNDEDIAETRPVTPAPHTWLPPTPPPKDKTRLSISPKTAPPHKKLRQDDAGQTATVNPASGELTPPYTPTTSQYLSLTYSPSAPGADLGAIWAAGIAKTYQFDLVYVVSLWPSDAGSDYDPSRRRSKRSHRSSLLTDASATTSSSLALIDDIIASPSSGMTGRFLAGYGLNQVESPFRIRTSDHLENLAQGDWKEFRESKAKMGVLNRGWAHAFYSDHVPILGAGSEAVGASPRKPNRGIVFAGYSKRGNRSTIPINPGVAQEKVLQRLQTDAKILIDHLIDGDC